MSNTLAPQGTRPDLHETDQLRQEIARKFSPSAGILVPSNAQNKEVEYHWCIGYQPLSSDHFCNPQDGNPGRNLRQELLTTPCNASMRKSFLNDPAAPASPEIWLVSRGGERGGCLVFENRVLDSCSTNSLEEVVQLLKDLRFIEQQGVEWHNVLGGLRCILGYRFSQFAAVFDHWIIAFDNRHAVGEFSMDLFNNEPEHVSAAIFACNFKDNVIAQRGFTKAYKIIGFDEPLDGLQAWFSPFSTAADSRKSSEQEGPKKRDMFGIRRALGNTLLDRDSPGTR